MHGSIQDYLWCDIIMNTVADLLAFLLSLTAIDYLCMLRYFSTLRLVLVTDESNENNDDMVAFVTPQAVDPTAGPSFSFRIRHSEYMLPIHEDPLR